MTTEDRVLALWEDANPIRNAEVSDLVRADATTYLATLAQRSSEMTKLDTKEETEKLFSDFVRIKNAKTRNILGSGLGLSILKKIAQMYGLRHVRSLKVPVDGFGDEGDEGGR